MAHNRRKWIFIVPAAILGLVLFVFIGGTLVQLLWNWLVPPLFNGPLLTFWQALGLLLLSRILVGGMGRHGGRYNRRMDFTPEEKERFRQRMRERLGFAPPTSASQGQ